MDREAAAQLAMVKEEEEEKKEEVELSVVNEGFVDGGEESGEYETAIGGGEGTVPKSFYGFPPPTGPRPSFFAAENDGPKLPTPVRPLRWKRIGMTW